MVISALLLTSTFSSWAIENATLSDDVIQVGDPKEGYRRLFFDPLLIERKSGVERVFHPCQKYPGNPLLTADTPWESGGSGPYLYGTVLHDDGKLRMWYHFIKGGYRNAYAESTDGIRWTKPELGILEFDGSKRNNLFLTVAQDPTENPPRKQRGQCHNPNVIKISNTDHPDCRYALFCYGADYGTVRMAFSADGLRWNFVPETARNTLFESGDVVNFFYDPYVKRYVATWKGSTRRGRSVGVVVSSDGFQWEKPSKLPIFTADDLDPPDTQIYGMPVFPYQGLYIGMPWIYHAVPHYADEMLLNREEAEAESPCTVDVQLAWSWDLINWSRPPERKPFISLGDPEDFDSHMIFTARAPVVVNGKLYFYYGGFDVPHNARSFNTHGAIGLAILRLDGFCSMHAGEREGWLITRRELLKAPAIWINARTSDDGYVRAEILDVFGNVVDGFSQSECRTFRGDSTRHLLRWRTNQFPQSTGRIFKIRFYLKNADLYSYLPSSPIQR